MTARRQTAGFVMRIPLMLGLLWIAAGDHGWAAVRTFRTLPNDEKNVVQFVSNATLERIVGRTNAITGAVDLDLNNVRSLSRATFEVDLRTMDTGIAMRNQDMRVNYLQTDEHPKATFTLRRIVSSSEDELRPNESVAAMAQGDFTVHGVTRSYEIPLSITYTPAGSNPEAAERLYGGTGDLINVSAEWRLKLADHGIIRPSFLFMRLAEEQILSVAFALTDVVPPR